MKLFGSRKSEKVKLAKSRGCLSTLATLSFAFAGLVLVVGYFASDSVPTSSSSSLQPNKSPIVKQKSSKTLMVARSKTATSEVVVDANDEQTNPLIPYRILNHNEVKPYKVSYDVQVDLVDGKLPTEEQLAAISNNLVSFSPHERKFVGFYLPDMEIDAGYFATAHHLPKLEVKINSWSVPDKYKSIRSGSEQPQGLYRTWKSKSGNFSAEARLLDFTDSTAVIMRREPWKTITVPVEKLSKADAEFLATCTQNVIVGRVISVTDGDTITVRDDEKFENYKIRLVGIDTPETGQDYGNKAKKALFKLVEGKNVRVRWKEKDRYGRILGNVLVHDEWVNHKLVQDGWAWHYIKYSDDPDLAEAERIACDAEIGLWADPNKPMPPWDFRNRPKPPSKESLSSQKSAAPTLGYWLNTSSNVRHNSSCRYFNNTKRGRACSADEGKACGICGG